MTGSDPDRDLEEILAEHRDDDGDPDTDPDDDAPAEADLDPLTGLAAAPAAAADQEDADSLPDAPLFALLRRVQDGVGAERIDRMWVFPPRRLEAAETAVVVVAAFSLPGEDRRRVYAAHYTALEDADEARLVLQEFGTAPTDRVGRLVEEVVERLNEDPAGAPRSHRIDGDPRRWDEVLHALAEDWLERARTDRRLRR